MTLRSSLAPSTVQSSTSAAHGRVSHRRSWLRAVVVSAGFACALLVTGIVSLSIGPAGVPVSQTIEILVEPLRAGLIGASTGEPVQSEAAARLVWGIRMPRVVLAMLVGAGLAAAGVVMQAVFRNSLAEPGVTGVSAGAAVAAVLCIVSGIAALLPWILPVAAFAGALVSIVFVQLVAGWRGGSGATLLLVGIALNAFLGAIVSMLIANAASSDDAQQAMFWLNGDLTGSNWSDVGLAVLPIVLGVLVMMFGMSELNLFLLGDEQASATGVNAKVARHLLLVLASVVTAAGVAVTGVISFVGLVVPHLIRIVVGSDHRYLLPISTVVGAIFLVLADTVARNLFDPVVLQTGIVTAFIGAPVLLFLVMKGRR